MYDTSAGYYQDGTAQTTQKACQAGTYQTQTGKDGCDDAEAGYYSWVLPEEWSRFIGYDILAHKLHVQQDISISTHKHHVLTQMQEIIHHVQFL